MPSIDYQVVAHCLTWERLTSAVVVGARKGVTPAVCLGIDGSGVFAT